MKDVVLTGTRVDAHGEQIAREALHQAFDQMPIERLMNDNHDLSLPPIGRAFNKRLRETDDGHLEIVVDVEVLDEAAWEGKRGLSISFTGVRPLLERRGGELTAQVLFDPNQIDGEQLRQALEDFEPDLYGYELIELRRKSTFAQTVIHVINFLYSVDKDLWHGFWLGVGPYLLGSLSQARRTAQRSADDPSVDGELTRIDVVVPAEGGAEVVLRLASDVSAEDLADIDLVELERVANKAVGEQPLFRVVVDVQRGGSYAIRFVTDKTGGTYDESP
jgi:hypothetical protein